MQKRQTNPGKLKNELNLKMSNIIYQNKVLFPEILWERPVHFYKAQAGKVLVLAGSKGMAGAAILTCEIVFRSGTGILVLGFPEGLKEIYKEILPEAMTLALPQTPSGSLSKKAEDQIIEQAKSCDAAVIGPGLSTNAETVQLVWQLLFKINIPIVLDADGLTALAKGIAVMRSKETIEFMTDYFKKPNRPLVLTPHPGEALRILAAINFPQYKNSSTKVGAGKKIDAKYIENHKKEIAPMISNYLGAVVVLKGHDTVISEPSGRIIINSVGGPELATAGTGDVLSGMVGSFVAQNPKKIFEATSTAVYLHGLAGQIAKEKVGERSVVASDIIRFLPDAIRSSEEMPTDE